MSMNKKYDCIVSIESKKITFNLSESKLDYPQDIEGENIRLQIYVAKLFVKLLNFIREEKDLFQKEDFNLLGDVLGKIFFGGAMASRFLDQLLLLLRAVKDSTCRFYLDFNDSAELTDLPWEYTKITEEQIYLAANEDNRFQLIRQLSKQPAVHGKAEKLNLIVVICDGNGGSSADGIFARDPSPLLHVLDDLKKEHPDRFHYVPIVNPHKEEFPAMLMEQLKALEKQEGRIPPYLVHYFGHARLRERRGELIFNTRTDGITWIRDDEFAGFFDKDFLASKGGTREVDVPEAVMFQACDSAKIGSLLEGRGVAIAMCRNNIPAVVGMQNEIDVESSSQFSKIYYSSLLKGQDIAEAITNGRFYLGHMYKIESKEDIFGNNLFGSPVLFINTKEPVTILKKVQPQAIIDGKEDAIQKKKCPKCHMENDSDAYFCKRCSFSFQDTRETEAMPSAAENRQKLYANANRIKEVQAEKSDALQEASPAGGTKGLSRNPDEVTPGKNRREKAGAQKVRLSGKRP